jgi:hypothetical protein
MEYSLVLRCELLMEPVVEEDGDDEVGKAHSRKDESPQRSERPERHLELAFWFLGVLEGKHETKPRHKKA